MTKEELIKLSRENLRKSKQGSLCECYDEAFIKGYELSEKRIAELEAEVKEWKDKADLWCNTANLKDHNIMINKELEKENAELKKQLEMSNKVYNDNCDYSHHIEEQLTKAKEIIRQLLLLPYANNEEVYADVTSTLNKAEQFLNSEVEK